MPGPRLSMTPPAPPPAPATRAAFGRRAGALAALLILAGALACDATCFWPSFVALVPTMNDVPAITQGYRETPDLLRDGLRWWHGPWIREGIQAYRPLTSYLHWIELWIGFHWGFIWVALLGFRLCLPL